MSNLTANKLNLITRPNAGRETYVLADGVTFYANSLVGTNAAGYLAKWADTAGHKFEGLLLQAAVGSTSATPPVEGRVDTSGCVLQNVPVASLAQSDVNGLVYCASDNIADLSLSASTNVKAVGRVIRYRSSGYGDVQLFTPAEHYGLN